MGGAGARVLVIDDSRTILKVVSVILANSGYQVAVARDGSEGFEQLRKQDPFDLVLLDFVMPRMNGYQFCRQLRSDDQFRNLPVVLMSARTNTIGDRFVEQTGAVDALSKPFDARALVAVVGNVLAKRKDDEAPVMPSPDMMMAEDELSAEPVSAGPKSDHFRSLGKMSDAIVEAIAPAVSKMRPQDLDGRRARGKPDRQVSHTADDDGACAREPRRGARARRRRGPRDHGAATSSSCRSPRCCRCSSCAVRWA